VTKFNNNPESRTATQNAAGGTANHDVTNIDLDLLYGPESQANWDSQTEL